MENTQPTLTPAPSFLKAHAPAFILAALLGILVSGTSLLVEFNYSFRPPFPETANDQNFYLSRIQDVRDGYTASGNTYIESDQLTPPMQFLTGEIIEANILDVLHLPTSAAVILFPLLFAPLIFLLTYALFLEMKAPPLWALLGTAYLCFGVFFSDFARLISPQFNFILWLMAVWWLFKIEEKGPVVWAVGGAVFTAALFYVYPYYWTHLLVVLGLLCIFYAFARKWQNVASLVGATLGALILAIPYIMLALSARTLPFFQESMTRLGFIESHLPSGLMECITYGTGFLAVAFILWRFRKFSREVLLAGALLLGGFIALNQHVVTGINMEFSSHYHMQIEFSFWFLIAAFLGLFGRWPAGRLRAGIIAVVGIASALAVGGAYLTSEAISHEPAYAQYAALTDWITAHEKPDESVYAPEPVAAFIPAYTPLDVFYARNANIGFMPNSEVTDRFIIENFHADFTKEFITAHEQEVFGRGFLNAYNHATEVQKALSFIGVKITLPERIPEDAIARVQARAAELQKDSFEHDISRFNADYFIADSKDPNAPTPADLSFAKSVFETGSFTLYERI